jgi:hypothetical protein
LLRSIGKECVDQSWINSWKILVIVPEFSFSSI